VKTIAISIDEPTLRSIDRFVRGQGGSGRRSRSEVVRRALQEFLARHEQIASEEREREIWQRHAKRIARQAKALIAEQAEP
jgi:metal-responsive CopG/Arc/MetJ family transcriptional regulator